MANPFEVLKKLKVKQAPPKEGELSPETKKKIDEAVKKKAQQQTQPTMEDKQ